MELFKTLKIYQDKIFWGIFILTGLFLVGGIFSSIPLIEIPIGLILIILGINRLLHEIKTQESEKEQDYLNANMQNMHEAVSRTHQMVKKLKKNHDMRFHNLNQYRILSDRKFKQKYRDIARKTLEIENELSDIKRLLKGISP